MLVPLYLGISALWIVWLISSHAFDEQIVGIFFNDFLAKGEIKRYKIWNIILSYWYF